MRVAIGLTYLCCIFLVTGGSQLSSEPKKALISTSTVSIPKELESIDAKPSGQLLELIVKIAEHPDTWEQIHRVLETLEANNAAYSNRIQLAKNRQELQAPPPEPAMSTVEHLSDRRNDVPEKQVESYANSGRIYQQWKDILFADESFHPQLKAAEDFEKILNSPVIQLQEETERPVSSASAKSNSQPTSQHTTESNLENEKSFDDRLKEIERELRKLSKFTRLTPRKHSRLQVVNEKKLNVSHFSFQLPDDKTVTNNLTKTSKNSHKFIYHRVGNMSDNIKLTGNNIWKTIALARNNSNNSRRKTFVAVSLLPNLHETVHKSSLNSQKGDDKGSSPLEISRNGKGKNCQKPWKKKHAKSKQIAEAQEKESKS